MILIFYQPNDNIKILSQYLESLKIIENFIGKKWFDKRLEKLTKKNKYNMEQSKVSKGRKFTALFQVQEHELIQEIYQINNFIKSTDKENILPIEVNKQIMKLIYRAKLINTIKGTKGINKFPTRLKDIKEFESTFFEIEVAAFYIKEDWKIEFIEESTHKTPDMKARKNHITMWIECKRRKLITERDTNIKVYWNKLQQKLLKYLTKTKINIAIIIKSLEDPLVSNMNELYDFIINSIRNGGIGDYSLQSGEIIFKKVLSNKYEITIKLLSKEDDIISQNDFILPDGFMSILSLHTSNTSIMNPILLGFKDNQESDKVSGIVNSFKSAVKQLPKTGPGCIWIRIPDDAWGEDDLSLARAITLLEKEMQGTQNRRINHVVLSTVNTKQNIIPEKVHIIQKPMQKIIHHKNPINPTYENYI